MAVATLSAPLTLDPRQAVTLRVRTTKVDHDTRVVGVAIDYIDAGGNVVHTVSRQLSGAQIESWISNQESALLTRYMAAAGLTGTVS